MNICFPKIQNQCQTQVMILPMATPQHRYELTELQPSAFAPPAGSKPGWRVSVRLHCWSVLMTVPERLVKEVYASLELHYYKVFLFVSLSQGITIQTCN